MSGLGPSFLKIWTWGSYPRSWSRNPWTRIKNFNDACRLRNFWNFFGAIQMISCRGWWSWTKPGYITMIRRQSNNHWSGGIAAHPAPKNSECKNPLEKFSPRFFWGSRRHPLIDYLPKGQTINAEYYSSLLVQLKDILKEKHRGKVTKGVLFLHDNAPAHRALVTYKKLVYLGSQRLDHTPYSPDLALSITTCSLVWKSNWKVAIFRPTRRSLLPRRPGWTDNFLNFFLVACKRATD